MKFLRETEIPIEKRALFDRLMSEANARVYVLGRNKYAERISRAINVAAFIDDFTAEKTYLDRPVIRMTDVPRESPVISSVVAGNSLTALDRLRASGIRNTIDYFTLSRLSPLVFAPVDYCYGNQNDILENTSQYEWVYNHLEDDLSKLQFEKVVGFRQTMDIEVMQGLTLRIAEQYFEDFLPRASNSVFVDGGGYDGKTTLDFVRRNKDYRRIYYFEPTPAMMEASMRNLNDVRDVRFLQKGIFNRKDRLNFDTGADQANSINQAGSHQIEVVSLDEEINEPITFIKLDIEGAEYEAIEGAKRHIESESPTMAICVYHKQCDFWRIPVRILKYNPNYRLYLRHYTQGVHETVMFFVPQERCS